MKPSLAPVFATLFTIAFATSCQKEQLVENNKTDSASDRVIAVVTLPENSKITYSEVDQEGNASGLKSVWNTSDYFYALMDSGQQTRFDLISGEGTSTATFAANVSNVTDKTKWVAVLGKNMTLSSSLILCSYDKQDGDIANLADCDFIVMSATGTAPHFDVSAGKRSSYFMRIKLPAGIRYIEYCTAASWKVAMSDATPYYKVEPIYDGHFNNVNTIDLGKESESGDCCYIAIPAGLNHDYINYNIKGVILTFMNEAKTKSNGRVLSADLRERGGKIGTFDLTSMSLIDRPTTADAISFGAATVRIRKDGEGDGVSGVNKYNNLEDYVHSVAVSPEWAPFNLGAKQQGVTSVADYYSGTYYSWGEIASRTTFSSSEYTYSGTKKVGQIENFASTQLGVMEIVGVSDGFQNSTMKLQRISGTKYDAARVQWGAEWRMPTPEEMMMFTGSSVSYRGNATTETGFTVQDLTGDFYNIGIVTRGRVFSKYEKDIIFPYCGRCLGGTKWQAARGFYWTDSRIRATPSNAALTNAPLIFQVTPSEIRYGTNTADQGDGVTQDPYYGFNIRPVRNYPDLGTGGTSAPSLVEEGSVHYHGTYLLPNSTVYGFIQDTDGNAIPGVTVSDGFTCVSTDKNGVYQMHADDRARTIAVTVPAEYKFPVNQTSGAVWFYSNIVSLPMEQGFTLEKRQSVPERFTLIVLTDEHVSGRNSGLARFATAMDDVQSTVTTLAGGLPVGPSGESAGEIIGISLGDQIWDDMNYASSVLGQFRRITTSDGSKMPFFYTIGNHDYDNSKSSDYEAEAAYISSFGPTNYSFDIANAHVVVMDDIIMTANGESSIKYKEGFTTDQVNWLKSDIAKVSGKSDKIVVFCTHAPLNTAASGDADAQNAVMSQLKNNFKAVHVFSGHTHCTNNNYYKGWTALGGRNITEHTIQALCGFWWKANISYVNGSPAGYGVYTFDSDDLYAEYNKLTNARAGFQARVYEGDDTYNKNGWYDDMMHGGSRGYKEYTWDAPAKDKFVVRIWDAASENDTDNRWTVKIGSTILTRVTTPIKDACAASFVFNKANKDGDYADADNITDQLWYGGSISSSFTCELTHTLPSGWSATYTISKNIGTGYEGFASDSNYDGF